MARGVCEKYGKECQVTKTEWYEMTLRWIYENGLPENRRPTWVNQALDMAWKPYRDGDISRNYPHHDMQIGEAK